MPIVLQVKIDEILKQFNISSRINRKRMMSTTDRNCDDSNSNCVTILSDSFSPQTYEELIDRNPDIKFNSSIPFLSQQTRMSMIMELFVSGLTSSHDLSDLTVSIFPWTVYCCKDGERNIEINHQ